jgi:hypothetical protein
MVSGDMPPMFQLAAPEEIYQEPRPKETLIAPHQFLLLLSPLQLEEDIRSLLRSVLFLEFKNL